MKHCNYLGYKSWEESTKDLGERPLKPENFNDQETYKKARESAIMMRDNLQTIYVLVCFEMGAVSQTKEV